MIMITIILYTTNNQVLLVIRRWCDCRVILSKPSSLKSSKIPDTFASPLKD